MQHEIKKSVPCNMRSSCRQPGNTHYKTNPNLAPRSAQRMHKNAQSCLILHQRNSPNPSSKSLKINNVGFDRTKEAAQPPRPAAGYICKLNDSPR